MMRNKQIIIIKKKINELKKVYKDWIKINWLLIDYYIVEKKIYLFI